MKKKKNILTILSVGSLSLFIVICITSWRMFLDAKKAEAFTIEIDEYIPKKGTNKPSLFKGKLTRGDEIVGRGVIYSYDVMKYLKISGIKPNHETSKKLITQDTQVVFTVYCNEVYSCSYPNPLDSAISDSIKIICFLGSPLFFLACYLLIKRSRYISSIVLLSIAPLTLQAQTDTLAMAPMIVMYKEAGAAAKITTFREDGVVFTKDDIYSPHIPDHTVKI